MGSKKVMLQNGLGDILNTQAKSAKRFVDLFSGSGAVVWFASQRYEIPTWGFDLQEYAVVIAKAVIERTRPYDPATFNDTWLSDVIKLRRQSLIWQKAARIDQMRTNALKIVVESRKLCENEESVIGPIWNAYGGHYFSPSQALTFDYMIKSLPDIEPQRSICLAATISAASKCVASPGHTAQPFQPTTTASPYILESWRKDPFLYAKNSLQNICPLCAKKRGKAVVGNSQEIAKKLKSTDLVFIDPPYSGVQYSRFYHVLETISRGKCGDVKWIGRYPPINERPQSEFCNKGQSIKALDSLIATLADSGCTVVITFPANQCSNGLSGDIVIESVKKHFNIKRKTVKGRFSTLGGNNRVRDARQDSEELILLLKPKQ